MQCTSVYSYRNLKLQIHRCPSRHKVEYNGCLSNLFYLIELDREGFTKVVASEASGKLNAGYEGLDIQSKYQ